MKYLFLGAHVDDIDLAAGGFIAKLREQRHEITVITLSHIYEGQDLYHEWDTSTQMMDVMRQHFNFTPRQFRAQRNEILQTLFSLGKFDIVVTHSVRDFHGDHVTVAREAIRAFKHSTILTFSGEWNHRQFHKNYFVPISHSHVLKKLSFLSCYKSQQHKEYFNTDVVCSQMKVNGLMCNHTFAEAFEIVNYVEKAQ
jgi:LmbE family N-acetylglucosaminyl deacetylase